MFQKAINWIDKTFIHHPLGLIYNLFNVAMMIYAVLLVVLIYQTIEKML